MNTRGFTLIELLVVIAIVGVMLSLATLAMRPAAAGDELHREAKRLQLIAGLLLDRAALRSETQALMLLDHGYIALWAGADGWRKFDDAPLDRERQLPSSMRLRLTIDNLPVALPSEPSGHPQLAFFASGETTPFRIELTAGRAQCQITSDGWPTDLALECREG